MSAADFAFLIAESDLFDWSLTVALVIGGALGFLVVWAFTRHTRRMAHEQAAELEEVARREAAVAAEEIRQKAEAEIQEKRAELNRDFDRREIESEVRLREIRAHEESLALLDYQLEQRQERLNRETAAMRQARDAIRALSKSVRQRLEGVSQMDAESIRQALREEVQLECQDELRALRREIMEKSEQDLQTEGRRIMIAAMQRLASKPNNDLTSTIVSLPNEDMKGRIIGREGRNIKAFEAATGVTVLIDESPQTVLISSFDPIRREVARGALEALIKDGRIHPATIEEFVKRAHEEIELSAMQAGEDAVTRLNINGLHPEIIKLLGKLKFRFSYNQNVLDHSVETASLASMIASEVGLDPNVAKRAGLLHDIGKAVNADYEGSHAHIGAEFIRRYGETPIVVNSVAAHHEEVKPETVYAGLVILADTISATRPGARAESMAGYIQRLGRLEKLAMAIDGVQQAFAIQAGREIRVVVSPQTVTDDRAREIAKELRKRIEAELQYPSTIKITVIREQRFTETAT
ncbi:ribonuclease Y [Opitutus terrae]|uniref:Ribonuclease Y n=1 Tax=Opitutus terrae (strain DSM 11246 / JCM 15787 / PB90-1) TaxID=452637 RepID=RNY_OPITP|nr:ribonuclease Y [Opitutus terrae]B1ZQ93.1 RecName: Full=Ribonuclease Y; Short=RNase Y [Opitutus terrae PB90-1]ACB73573.1 RNA binding metal dependent phosphohydrolase [Opitutus terrae PB90-1]